MGHFHGNNNSLRLAITQEIAFSDEIGRFSDFSVIYCNSQLVFVSKPEISL